MTENVNSQERGGKGTEEREGFANNGVGPTELKCWRSMFLLKLSCKQHPLYPIPFRRLPHFPSAPFPRGPFLNTGVTFLISVREKNIFLKKWRI